MRLGFVSLPGRGANDLLLAAVADHLSQRGLRLAGTVQSNVARLGRMRCDMDIMVLPDGPVLRISEDRGDLARGCRLDAGALETAVQGVARRLPGADLLLVNKFGKQEAEKHGLAPLIGDALAAGIPVLLGVNGLNLHAFHGFAGGIAVALPGEIGAVPDWCLADRSHSAA
ncbi:DUF2478 domain-containing protein [Paracoccus spongiarum]|uniref:DUF2478 domain-containing protein n=1 Tax=Paracoccus spongiarum TaxID=3064387 RepID=A0ABT9JD21_9RHOB|nr:DUF2478 domain-containing protein [Paracoccus sp. 2205BS29-5]MDP5307731.1 DUF2478 domain-containing protein [Paracoccus sp. 2205BS29-5]